MKGWSKVFVASLVLLAVAGIAAWADPTPLDPPKLPKPRTLERTADEGGARTQITPTVGAIQSAPIVPPIQTNSGSGMGHGSGLAGVSGSTETIGGGASGARASVERSLRILTETLR